MMKRILVSAGTLVFVGAVVASATGAFFSDTETSAGNVFTAGALDLKVDSTAHYNNMVCINGKWDEEPGVFPNDQAPADHYPQPGTECDGTWTETNLGIEHKFFNLSDVKPGDEGENTISLHVYDNDAWGKFVIDKIVNADNGCTEPEQNDAQDPTCDDPGVGDGELGANITFYAWLDQGITPGFQASTSPDTGEGDNVWDCTAAEINGVEDPNAFTPSMAGNNCNEPLVILPGPVGPANETHKIWEALGPAWLAYCLSNNPTGHTNYGPCHGLAQDGRMVGSTTYYFGLAWFIADTVGNIIQTDSLTADLIFQAVQHRNNPGPNPQF